MTNYKSQPDRTEIHRFVECAVSAPSADNSQPWMFSPEGDELVCRYRHVGDAPDPFGADGHGTLLAAGALHENIDRLLSMLGLEASARTGPPNWALRFSLPRQPLPDTPALRSILARHTNRHPYRPIVAPDLAGLPDAPLGSSRLVVLQERDAIRAVARAVGLCAQARFNTEALHEWLFTSLRWTPADVKRGDGLDIATVHLPPGGGLFMRFIAPWRRMALLNRLGIYRLLAAADTDPVARAPCLMAIVGDRTPEGIWDAGRHLQRLWIELNRRGYAVHPYYVLTDLGNRLRGGLLDARWCPSVTRAQGMVADLMRLAANEQVHILLRVGMATREPVRSRRRPAEAFLV